MRITRITTLVIETVETLVFWRATPAGKPVVTDERKQPATTGTDQGSKPDTVGGAAIGHREQK